MARYEMAENMEKAMENNDYEHMTSIILQRQRQMGRMEARLRQEQQELRAMELRFAAFLAVARTDPGSQVRSGTRRRAIPSVRRRLAFEWLLDQSQDHDTTQ